MCLHVLFCVHLHVLYILVRKFARTEVCRKVYECQYESMVMFVEHLPFKCVNSVVTIQMA